MSNTPKIMVFRLKELIYTAIFILLALLLIIFLVKMFNSDKKGQDNQKNTVNIESSLSETTNNSSVSTSEPDTENNSSLENNTSESSSSENNSSETAPSKKTPQRNYSPGVYTSSLVLNNSALEVEVCVDLDSINSISIKNMDEAITTMYPLMSGSIEDLEKQIIASQSLENITYSSENRYTYMVLLDAISHALSKAENEN